MTKQEEIKAWLENELDIHLAFKYSKQETAQDILSYLHSQGLRLPNGEALIDETNK